MAAAFVIGLVLVAAGVTLIVRRNAVALWNRSHGFGYQVRWQQTNPTQPYQIVLAGLLVAAGGVALLAAVIVG